MHKKQGILQYSAVWKNGLKTKKGGLLLKLQTTPILHKTLRQNQANFRSDSALENFRNLQYF